MSRKASPYMVPGLDAWELGRWEILQNGEWGPAPDVLEGWDPATDYRLRRTVRVDTAAIRGATLIPPEVPLRLATSWRSSTTGMTGLAGGVDLTEGLHTHGIILPGGKLGGIVSLRTTLTLGGTWAGVIGSAHLAGSVLLEEVSRMAVEGDLSMFPVSIVDFATTFYDPDASWHLTTSPDLEAPFMGTFLLEVNAQDAELVQAIRADKQSDRDRALIESLQQSVAMLMLEFAQLCDQDGAVSSNNWEPETVGGSLRRVLLSAGLRSGAPPADVTDLADRRSQLDGSTRRAGQGRGFL